MAERNDLRYRDWVTVADVLDKGVWIQGVLQWVDQHGGVIAGSPHDFPDNEIFNENFRAAAHTNGKDDCDGNGFGWCYGYGKRNGDGNSEFSGDGDCFDAIGLGELDGVGVGEGYGVGYGNGNGESNQFAYSLEF